MAWDKTQPRDNAKFRDGLKHLRWKSVKDRHLTGPPAAVEGDRYIVASVATGLWAGHENEITEYHAEGAVAITWVFVQDVAYLPIGFRCHIEDEDVDLIWNGTIWTTSAIIMLGADAYFEYTAGPPKTVTLYIGGDAVWSQSNP